MSTIAIVQARMESTRVPGKILMDLAGEPMLVRCMNRVRRASLVDDVLVATTDRSADDMVAAHAPKMFATEHVSPHASRLAAVSLVRDRERAARANRKSARIMAIGRDETSPV